MLESFHERRYLKRQSPITFLIELAIPFLGAVTVFMMMGSMFLSFFISHANEEFHHLPSISELGVQSPRQEMFVVFCSLLSIINFTLYVNRIISLKRNKMFIVKSRTYKILYFNILMKGTFLVVLLCQFIALLFSIVSAIGLSVFNAKTKAIHNTFALFFFVSFILFLLTWSVEDYLIMIRSRPFRRNIFMILISTRAFLNTICQITVFLGTGFVLFLSSDHSPNILAIGEYFYVSLMFLFYVGVFIDQIIERYHIKKKQKNFIARYFSFDSAPEIPTDEYTKKESIQIINENSQYQTIIENI